MTGRTLEDLMREAFTVAGAYSEDGYAGWVGMLRANKLRTSLNALVEHRRSHAMDEAEIESWIRADIERIKNLSPSQRDTLTALGVMMSTLDDGDAHD